jgi:hypothetical protein
VVPVARSPASGAGSRHGVEGAGKPEESGRFHVATIHESPHRYRRSTPGDFGEHPPSVARRATITTIMTLALSRRTFLQRASGTLVSLGSGLVPAAAQNPTTQVFYDPATLRHEPGNDHPESPKRIDAVMEAVRTLERQGRLSVEAPRPATDDDILLVHSPQYLKLVRSETGAGRRTLSTGDTESPRDRWALRSPQQVLSYQRWTRC